MSESNFTKELDKVLKKIDEDFEKIEKSSYKTDYTNQKTAKRIKVKPLKYLTNK